MHRPLGKPCIALTDLLGSSPGSGLDSSFLLRYTVRGSTLSPAVLVKDLDSILDPGFSLAKSDSYWHWWVSLFKQINRQIFKMCLQSTQRNGSKHTVMYRQNTRGSALFTERLIYHWFALISQISNLLCCGNSTFVSNPEVEESSSWSQKLGENLSLHNSYL